MDGLFRFPSARPRDPAVGAWFFDPAFSLRLATLRWFGVMRDCGPDLRELIHDGCPVACRGEVAFAYVNAFRSHAAVGFFRGAELPDPAGLLEGSGRLMRHVKLHPGQVEPNHAALTALIRGAYSGVGAVGDSGDNRRL